MFNNIPAFSGLGKPSIRLEFESNEDLLEFQRKMNAGAPEPDPDDDPDDDGDGETFQRGGGDRYLIHKKLDGLGAPGDTYILTDTRKKARRELDELAKFKAFEIKKYNTEEGGGWDSVKLVDIKKIYKDPARFQNRETAESSESVNRIIKDAEAGRFDWAKFDPVTLWRDPRDGKLYVLSGHSRTRAFEKLSQAGALVNGRGFDKIPAKLFQGSEAQAIDFALNSNTLSTKETEIERANYYRRKLQNGTPAAEVLEEIKINEGKNYVRIWAYAHLNPRGLTWEALRTLQDTTSENSELIKIVAEWIGKIFTRYPQLTAEHDKEIYNYLVKEGAYGKGAGKVNNYQKLLEKVAKAIERRTEAGQFNQAARLNLLNLNESSENLKRFDETKKALAAELRTASAELARKRKEFFARQKQDKSITNAAINNALQPYIDEVNSLQKKIIELESNRGQYTAADRAQQALVFDGLGKPANDYLYNNLEILDYNGYKPTYKILDSYDSFFKESDKKTSFAGFGLDDTKKLIEKICTENYLDCWDIAKHLKANTLPQSCFNLWHWLHNNIRYEYDTDGLEEVRTPRRVWADRHRGVDCDCLSVFAWCVLRCMGYDPAFELVSFKNKKNFSHIFVNCNGVLVDRVWFIFNEEPPGVTNREIFKIKEVFNLGKLF